MPESMPIKKKKYATTLNNKKAQKLRLYLMLGVLTIL